MSDFAQPSSLIFKVNKRPAGTTIIDQSKPVLWTRDDKVRETEGCHVCQKHEARYTCPKCSMLYCSVECYKNHKSAGRDCTEIFYHDRVAGVMKLETAAKQDDFRRVLSRLHAQQPYNGGQLTGADEGLFDQKELLNILNTLEDGDELRIAQILRERPDLRAAVHASVRGAELNEWLLEPWYPWWRSQLVSERYGLLAEDEVPLCDEEDCRILDERLLEIRPFREIRPKGKEVPQQLRNHLLDILFAITSTLHLFHGCRNAVEEPLEASQFLIGTSFVLSEDGRLDSVHEAMARISSTVQDPGFPISQEASRYLLEDIAILSCNRRLIGRILLEASDILSIALRTGDLSKVSKKLTINSQKKIEFYLSWSQDLDVSFTENLAREVRAWLTAGSVELQSSVEHKPMAQHRLTVNHTSKSALIEEVSTVKRKP